MKRTLILLSLALAVPMVACKAAKTNTTPQALAPGYQNQADQIMGESLVGAHNFYVTIQQNVAAGKYKPSATEKTALNDFAVALNSAQILYIAYHAGTATQAEAQAAVNSVTTQQTTLQAVITGGKK